MSSAKDLLPRVEKSWQTGARSEHQNIILRPLRRACPWGALRGPPEFGPHGRLSIGTAVEMPPYANCTPV
eukprot:12912439-Alexandrium_andersonii.AAC.1